MQPLIAGPYLFKQPRLLQCNCQLRRDFAQHRPLLVVKGVASRAHDVELADLALVSNQRDLEGKRARRIIGLIGGKLAEGHLFQRGRLRQAHAVDGGEHTLVSAAPLRIATLAW